MKLLWNIWQKICVGCGWSLLLMMFLVVEKELFIVGIYWLVLLWLMGGKETIKSFQLIKSFLSGKQDKLLYFNDLKYNDYGKIIQIYQERIAYNQIKDVYINEQFENEEVLLEETSYHPSFLGAVMGYKKGSVLGALLGGSLFGKTKHKISSQTQQLCIQLELVVDLMDDTSRNIMFIPTTVRCEDPQYIYRKKMCLKAFEKINEIMN